MRKAVLSVLLFFNWNAKAAEYVKQVLRIEYNSKTDVSSLEIALNYLKNNSSSIEVSDLQHEFDSPYKKADIIVDRKSNHELDQLIRDLTSILGPDVKVNVVSPYEIKRGTQDDI